MLHLHLVASVVHPWTCNQADQLADLLCSGSSAIHVQPSIYDELRWRKWCGNSVLQLNEMINQRWTRQRISAVMLTWRYMLFRKCKQSEVQSHFRRFFWWREITSKSWLNYIHRKVNHRLTDSCKFLGLTASWDSQWNVNKTGKESRKSFFAQIWRLFSGFSPLKFLLFLILTEAVRKSEGKTVWGKWHRNAFDCVAVRCEVSCKRDWHWRYTRLAVSVRHRLTRGKSSKINSINLI